MAGQTDVSELCQKEEDKNEIKYNIDDSYKKCYEEDEKGDKKNSFCNIAKRYSRYDLLSLRNAQLSIHYPNCALRPDLQALSIWTCRLRCDLQYSGLWKIITTGNLFGNCSCNGSCQSTYTCNDGQPYTSSSSQGNSLNSQMCYGNVQQSQQLQPLQTTSSSPTLGSKRAVRSRERSLNYQRCINTELIRAISPVGSGECSVQYHLNHKVKPAFIDHRSISSSHLMPAFAKRRMGHTLHGQTDSSNFNNTEHFSNDNGSGETSGHFDTSIKSKKDSAKTISNQNDYHIYKSSPNSRLDKVDQLADNQTGWIDLVKKINSDYPMSNNKTSNTSNVNKKLIYERRIGSGRLVSREVNWDMRTGSNKQIEKENNVHANSSNNNGKKEELNVEEVDKLNNRNSSLSRYSETRGQERRIYDRRISNPDDSNNGDNNSTSKRFTCSNLGEERNNFDVNYPQQTQHFTGQRSMSFRRREYVDHKDHHRDLREFRDSKESRESREHLDQHHHNHHRDHKEEPEWFSEGPTSQHDTIELRGFEETDESQQHQEENYSGQYSIIKRKTSESSLLSHNSSNNANLSTKENVDISSKVLNNSNNTTTTSGKEIDNSTSCNSAKNMSTPNNETSNANVSTADTQHTNPKPEEIENLDIPRSNASELFFDQFLNIDALENSLIGSVTDQSMPSKNDGRGTSRFSRWFFNNSKNNLNSNEEFDDNPPSKDDSKRQNKVINESDFNSFMSFLKCNNFPTPELPKSLPSNVSALSVEELEARMRKMDSGEKEKSKCNEASHNYFKIDGIERKRSEYESEADTSPHSAEINTQDVEAFRKLLDQLGKPRVDISMNIILPNTAGQPHLTPPLNVYPTGMSSIPSSTLPPQSKQEYMMKMMHQQQLMHQQQNMGKIEPPLMHHGITQMSPQQQTENLPLISVPHNQHIPMIAVHHQKRLDVQHLIQSVIREELSRSFLEKELTNPNIPPYNKEIISTVLKETSRYNPSNAGGPNAPESFETAAKNDISKAPNNLMQSLARGEVSLNLLEHELNKLNNMNIGNETSNNGTFKERSRCGTPLAAPLHAVSIPTSGGVIVPLPHQVVPAQKQNAVLTNENNLAQQHQQAISSMLRPHHEDSAMHMPTQRELQMHTQAIMQNAIYKKKLEVEQHEALRRRLKMHKQQELESSSINQQSLNANSVMSQQGPQQTSRHIHSPTPLAFTPTSVLRKMTAEKDTITNTSQAPTLTSLSPQQIQPHLQQPHLKITTHPQIHTQQMSYQHSNQPRMILGGGNFQYMHQQQHQIIPASNGSPQVSPQQKSQIRNQPPGPLKWPLIAHSSMESNHALLGNLSNKPIGRPILKGPGPIQPLVPQNTHNPLGQNQSNIIQNSQSLQTVSQMQKYPSIQQPRQIVGQQFSTHIIQHQIPTSQQNNMQQHLFQQHQQRPVVLQRQQNDLGNHATLSPLAHHPSCNDNNSVANLNYQRDGRLSPTSNQLAQWFSPELLAQASAGKLPLLNMNQALSLEEFEKSIQHSSTAVNN